MIRKSIVVAAAMLLLSGCTTEMEARKKLGFRGESERSVAEVADCVEGELKKIKHVLVTRDKINNGVMLKMNVHGQFGTNVWAVVDVIAVDGKTTLEARGIGRTSKQPERDYATYIQCLKGS